MSEPAKFDAYAESYETLHARSVAASGESPDYFAAYKRDCLLRAGIPRDQPILDYGCGTGNLTALLADGFADVRGFDISPKSLSIAANRCPGARFCSSREALPKSTFAAVVLSCVLHHVAPCERGELLAFLRSRLVNGGRLVVFEHNGLAPVS